MATVVHLTSVHGPRDTRIFLKECRTLAAAGYAVHLVAADAEDGEEAGVRIHGVRRTGRGRLMRMTATVRGIYRRALEIDGDVYHVHDPELLPVALLLRRRGRLVVYDAHEHLPKQILTKPWLPRLARRPVAGLIDRLELMASRRLSAVVTATQVIRMRFDESTEHAVDVRNYPLGGELLDGSVGWANRERAIVYVGQITRIRGLAELVAALGLTDVRLLLAGRFVPERFGAQLSAQEGWRQVEYVGEVDRRALLTLVRRAIAGAVLFQPVPNHLDAEPTKLFEYMSAGLPVVVSDFPHWRGLVERYECGLCVDPGDPEQIAGAIQWLADHPEEAERMGLNGREAVARGINWESERSKLLELYDGLLAEAG